MCCDRVIVLKFGGSVLRDESTLRLAVHEIYRWRRARWGVVAVVSALNGRTESLLAQSTRIGEGRASAAAVAGHVALGELESAALLGLHLDRAGVDACVESPAGIGLRACGDALDGEPVDVDARLLRELVDAHGVVVVPGFVARGERGGTVVLGRGGSDLTALYLAHALGGVRCRLVKDVDGLYTDDPARAGARKFAKATYGDALGTDGGIVQHKAVRFARDHGLVFELGRMNGVEPSAIGGHETSFCEPEMMRPLRVALLGHGTVGRGVCELVSQMGDLFSLERVAVRSLAKHQDCAYANGKLTTDALGAVDDADVVVECIGGVDVAGDCVRRALNSGAHVVTANKALIAADAKRNEDETLHGRDVRATVYATARATVCATGVESLHAIARRNGVSLCYSASVGGSMPVLESLRGIGPGRVRGVHGILNGTTNYLVDALRRGEVFETALKRAQELGFAEADASRDLEGIDAADKLTVIGQVLGVRVDEVLREGLSGVSFARACEATNEQSVVVRHVARIARNDRSASVRLQGLAASVVLCDVHGERNMAAIELDGGAVEVVSGKGAGRWPTAESVVGDLLEIARRMIRRSGCWCEDENQSQSEGTLAHASIYP